MASTAAPSAPFLSPLPEPAPGGERGRLGDPGELHGEVAVGGLGLRIPSAGEAYRLQLGVDERLAATCGLPRAGPVGFMPDDEGLALHEAGLDGAPRSGRCSRSARTAASRPSTSARPRARAAPCCSPSTTTAARRRTRPGGSTTTSSSSTRAPAAWTRCRSSAARSRTPGSRTSWSRSSATRRRSPRTGRRRSGSLFIDGGHAFDVALADYEGWARHRRARRGARVPRRVRGPGRRRARRPFEVWQRAVADGFVPVSTTGSLRVLQRRRR